MHWVVDVVGPWFSCWQINYLWDHWQSSAAGAHGQSQTVWASLVVYCKHVVNTGHKFDNNYDITVLKDEVISERFEAGVVMREDWMGMLLWGLEVAEGSEAENIMVVDERLVSWWWGDNVTEDMGASWTCRHRHGMFHVGWVMKPWWF